MAYHAADGDPEHSNGRSASPNSYHGSRYALTALLGSLDIHGLTGDRPRSSRGRKEVGIIGQASWSSSVINLVNTSMRWQEMYGLQELTITQLLVPVVSPCPWPFHVWE